MKSEVDNNIKTQRRRSNKPPGNKSLAGDLAREKDERGDESGGRNGTVSE